ncbi:MAG: type I methionyl aminopeptidase, partial [Patescibacteria group bacterium]
MISIKTSAEIEIMAEGGKILAQIMKELEKMVQPGIKTRDLDKVAKDLVFKFGAKPSFLGYQDFPAVLCVSVNEEIVHGVPSDRILKQGDIISLDLGIFYKGFHTDMAVTVPVGTISKEAQKLIQVTKEALNLGISEVRPGNTFSDIGRAIQKYVEGHGFGVVRELCGHGIGKEVHEEPQVLNYLLENSEKDDIEIKEGMV